MDNQKQHVKGKQLVDFDGVSLYPSAMQLLGLQLGGYLQGKPNLLKPHERNKELDCPFTKLRLFPSCTQQLS